MPAFNAAKTIQYSIDSVLNQSYHNWELIIINDASVDETEIIVNNNIDQDDRIRVVNIQLNEGLSAARNHGILNANGELLAFLDSDDLWHVDKLKIQVKFHIQNPSIKVSHTNFNIFDESGLLKRPFKKIAEFGYKKEGKILPSLYSKNTIGVLTVMIEKNILLDTGGFDVNLWTMEDQDLWIRIAKKHCIFGYVNIKLASYRINANGITSKIGKYKRAYKNFINKYYQDIDEYKYLNKVYANYYRYFGLLYSKKRDYNIAFYYALKSFQFEKNLIQRILLSALILNIASKRLLQQNEV